MGLQMVEDDNIYNSLQKKLFSTEEPIRRDCSQAQNCQEGGIRQRITINNFEVFQCQQEFVPAGDI